MAHHGRRLASANKKDRENDEMESQEPWGPIMEQNTTDIPCDTG
jgi:hypothetical protein